MDPILSDNLTAYRKTHSCKTTLIRLVEEWKMELDSGKLVGMLPTDMSKAFDSLYSPLLIKKLESYRFSDKALDLVISYFIKSSSKHAKKLKRKTKNSYRQPEFKSLSCALCETNEKKTKNRYRLAGYRGLIVAPILLQLVTMSGYGPAHSGFSYVSLNSYFLKASPRIRSVGYFICEIFGKTVHPNL